ncbi:MAG: short chain dehydrogenase [Gammaproteobacteria bacterium RIFCSPHIGHO2_12_FULL_45_9]|nr:MAG: short chain dehydrogenase [Gammaproteobacteria bacterium RIFCSPHIGHO2_12_FULL_45_9]
MKILIIGASGTIGCAIVQELKRDTQLVSANYQSGDYRVDLANSGSIVTLFKQIGQLNGIVCAASRGVIFKPLIEMTTEDYLTSMQQKLFGQLRLVLEGIKVLSDHSSITLTTGLMNHDFVLNGSAAALVNHAVEGFVKAAALDMPRGIRINVVSPALLEESVEKYAELCPGFEPVSSAKVARAYRKSIYGIQSGQVYHVT